MPARKRARTQWYRVDLHLHTPASADYLEPTAGYIDILRKAEQRGLDIIAFTDHNTAAGYSAMMREIEQLAYLQDLGRANADELRLLAEYRRLLDKLLVLPGFEFTATFGFHILGIFAPHTPVRLIEHLLLKLNIPPLVLDAGSSEVGASSDVLSVYRAINEAGGICIAAHVNSAHGVAMTDFDFGGQTRIAYTQDRHLHALEVTDLGKRDRRSTQKFFDGTKPEYPRRMLCVQGSDAHALTTIRDRTNRVITLGVGERVTEVALVERSFEALLEMFQSGDSARARPYNPNRQPEDYVQLAREEGNSIIQSFHELLDRKALSPLIEDVCAFANTNGGTLYIGLSADKKKKILGVTEARESVEVLRREISQQITPALRVEIDLHEMTGGKMILRVQVPYGEDRPYAIDGNRIYVRDEGETSLAVRDEIVSLVRQGLALQLSPSLSTSLTSATPAQTAAPSVSGSASAVVSPSAPIVDVRVPDHRVPDARPAPTRIAAGSVPSPAVSPAVAAAAAVPHMASADASAIAPPRAGVEIIDTEVRDGKQYYTMHDLRNGNIVRNVTMSSARRLWHYAVKQKESNPPKPEQITWVGNLGLLKRYKKGGDIRYDLAQRENGRVRIYYGVTENGMHDAWQQFIVEEAEERT